jgi:LmbE family N-acetylglucosaminyl deacetylase
MTMPEADAIPFAALDLRGERLLVLAPHPDDEAIGCGGLIALHRREGRRVRVVVVTDGAEAGDAAQREAESRAALTALGGAEVEFFRYRDRQLAGAEDLPSRLAIVLRDYRPDLIAVPNPIEIHPDHAALARAFCDLVAADPSLFAELAVARVAFYEVSHPLHPNTLVDITPVAGEKYAAIANHETQLAHRDYVGYARGLNAYRSMTLPRDVKYAEAFHVMPLPELRTTPFSAVRTAVAAPPAVEVARENLPISVVVRTRDRPALLREALQSIRATGYPAEIVVVNDGGTKPDIDGIALIHHDASRGRSEAANSGVRAATSAFVVFLDDDDLFYPEHLATLSNVAAGSSKTAWYTDAVSAFVTTGPSGALQNRSRLRLYAQDFDRELLLIDNYVPLPTLLLRRDAFLELGGFDPAFDLFEDWDFLIRLAQRGDFVRVPRITCEIRHIAGGGSIILDSPEGSARFRAAKLQVWDKHRDLLSDDVLANVFERQKRRVVGLESEVADARGVHGLAEQTMAQGERDKASLLRDLGALQERLNEALMRISLLEGAGAELRDALAAAQNERNALLVRVGELGDARAGFEESQRTVNALWGEISRLQSLLDTIYQSRTWKLHSILERMKGRG